MADHSPIEWTDATWNPVTGCTKVSAGCDHCYAERIIERFHGPGSFTTVRLHPDRLTLPQRWRTPRRVFTCSMADLFHPRVPVGFVAQVWAVMARTPRHTYQILTKRPARMRRVVGDTLDGGCRLLESLDDDQTTRTRSDRWPLPNVWLDTSIESDHHTGRADELRAVAAAVRFLSLEPLLGPMPSLDLTGIDWVIVGGESGPGHRPLDLGWVRDIRDRCLAHGVPLFLKQIGGRTPTSGGRLLDGATWDQVPAATSGRGVAR